jgi:Mg2+/Co2+ transporter CorB
MIWLLLALILLIIISGFFSSSETALMAINRYRLRHLSNQNIPAAKRVEKFLKRPDRLLGAILIGNTFANIAASALATTLAAKLYGATGIAVTTLVLTFIILIFAEITPKSIAAFYPLKVSFAFSLPLKFIFTLFYPLVWISNLIARGLLRAVGISLKNQSDDALSPEEMRTLVNETSSLIPQQSQNMLLGILDLKKITVNDIMTPRNQITGLDLDDEEETLLKYLSSAQHSLLPIYHESIDTLSGIIHMRRAFSLLDSKSLVKDLKAIACEPYFIPELTPLSTQLIHFKKLKHHAAFVVDEYGDIQGMITITDILEEIVGDYATDISLQKKLDKQKDGSYIINGDKLLRDLNREMHWSLPTKGPNTLNGFILEYLQQIPNPGSTFKVESIIIEILRVADNQIQVVKVWDGGNMKTVQNTP